MKLRLVNILCLCLLLAACSFPRQTQTPEPQPDPFSTRWEDLSIFKDGLVESEQSVLTEMSGASIYHIDLNIAEDLNHVSGRQEVQYTSTETVVLDQIHLRLFPNILGGSMEVSNILAGGQNLTPERQLNDSLLILPLPAPLQPGESTLISMDFQVTVPQTVELNYGVLAYDQDVLTLAHAYPMIAVYNEEGWNAEIPPQSGDVTYADAAFFLVKITAPHDLTVVTSGRELDRRVDDQIQTLWIASGPARDFYLAASPLYEEFSETLGEVTIRSYAPKELEEGARLALETAAKAIRVFSSRYAPYPYSEFDIVSTPTLAFGVEYPGMTAIASRLYELDEQIRGTPVSIYLESTVAHETGHMWFYNLVGNDQLDDPWLDESLTQFVTLQYYEDEYGGQAAAGFQESLEARWASVDYAEIPIGLPVAEYSGKEYSPIVYGRGPLFFVALRDEMGDEAFNAFLQDYTQQLSWKIATPEFLQSLAEKHCACDLGPLFKVWVTP